ncbi:group I truncated hemoglobin [Pontibacterium sinense]|nr:group 1 truncated hemoglobin [Pontibacterium sinense]
MQSIRHVGTSVVMALLLIMMAPLMHAGDQKSEPSLYNRLGGAYAIASVVDDFIERLLVNDVLNANPAIKSSRDRVPKAGLKFHVTMMVSEVTGGPEKYTGRTMKDSHVHLNITSQEWDAMVADFKVTLAKFEVPEKEQQELIAIVATTKADIVMSAN